MTATTAAQHDNTPPRGGVRCVPEVPDVPANPDVTAVRAARRSHWGTHVALHATSRPAAPALRFRGSTTTWSQLHQRSQALAAALYRRGVVAGDRVAVLTTNRPEHVETLLAATALGAMAVPLNFRLAAPEVAHILGDCSPRVVVVDAELEHLLPAGQPRLVTGAGLEAALTEPGGAHPGTDVAEDSPALIMYTSGTTGRPKGAVLTHANLAQQGLTLIRGWQLFDDDAVNLCASPLFHIAAIGSIAPMLQIGVPTVIAPSGAFDPVDLLDTLEREQVTCVFLVPAQWQAVCAVADVAARHLSLRVISWGAAPASDVLLRRMAQVFPDVTNVACSARPRCRR